MLCQYSSVIASRRPFLSDSLTASTSRIEFDNGASLVLSTNSPLVYTKKWKELLVRYDPDHRPFLEYDAYILGKFNTIGGSVNTSFHKMMLEAERAHPGQVQYSKVSPPTLVQFARTVTVAPNRRKKPIIVVSMFAAYGKGWEKSCRSMLAKLREQQQQQQQQRARAQQRQSAVQSATNASDNPWSGNSTYDDVEEEVLLPIRVLSGRAHIEALGTECGTDGSNIVSECWNAGDTTPFGRKPQDMHRCTGPGGGHPDLLAWDVVEALHELLADA
jgi:hypothetical protein